MDADIEPVKDNQSRQPDSDLPQMSAAELISEVLVLRNAIRQHRDERGHDRCWVDDARLYRILPEKELGDMSLPPREEFLANCARYFECRQPPKS